MAKLRAYEESGESINGIFEKMQAIFKAMFGISNFDLSTAKGFFAMVFLYILLLAAVYAAILGAEIVSKEARDKTNEFLLSKPISRKKILLEKSLAGLSITIAFWLISILSSVIIVDIFNKGAPITKDIWYLSFGLLVVQIFFYSLGLFIGSSIKQSKLAPSVSSGAVLFCYFAFVIYKLNPELDILKFVTPFEIFDANNILVSGYSYLNTAIYFLVFIIFTVLAFLAYQNKEQLF